MEGAEPYWKQNWRRISNDERVVMKFRQCFFVFINGDWIKDSEIFKIIT